MSLVKKLTEIPSTKIGFKASLPENCRKMSFLSCSYKQPAVNDCRL